MRSNLVLVLYILSYIYNMNQFKHTKFNIRFISKQGKGNRSFSTNKIGTYTKENETHEVYFRPEEPCYILVDLDSNPSLGTLTSIAKAKAFLIVQTSKTRYQAWFYCPDSKDWETYEKVAKYLANKFDGDMGAAHKKQVGRLPNYKNHKRNGFKTKIHYSSSSLGTFKMPSNIGTRTASGAPPPPPPKRGGTTQPSRFDDMRDWGFINMCYERNRNLTYNDLVRIMRSQSAHGNNETYVRHTVENVMNYQRNR